MSKRLLSILLALCMVLALLSGTVWAAEVVSGTCGDNLTWTLDADGTLTISGTGAMTNFGFNRSVPWYSQRNAITTVAIGNGVTSIGQDAFSYCRNLISVTIPDSVTTIGSSSFDYCESLTSITIPGGVATIEDSTFSGCSSLTSVIIPNSVTSIGYNSFSWCTSLTSVTIPDSVTSIGFGAFAGCTGLASVTIPSSVIDIDSSAFNYCTSLTSINVANGNPAYTSVDGVLFSVDQTRLYSYPGGKSTTPYHIPDSVTSIEFQAFRGCTGLTNVILPDSVISTGSYAFYDCSNLSSVTIPDSVTEIGDWSFFGCSSLTNVDIPDSVIKIRESAFLACSSLTSVTIPDGVTYIGMQTFGNCSSLTIVTIPGSVTSIDDRAFYECNSLTDVYYGGSESQWNQIRIYEANDSLYNATIHYGGASLELTPAVKYVYYSVQLPSPWRAVAGSLPSWLSADGSVLSGIPTQAGEYTITLTDGSSTQTVTLTVRENGDNSVRASMSEGYVVVQEFPDIVQEESVWIIDDVQPPAPGEPDIFDRLLDVYLDGRKLKGGKLEDGQQIPDDWEYYARRGSLMTTLLTQTKANNTQGQHTLSVTISKPNNNSVSTTTAVDTVSTNYYVSSYDPQTESYPFSDGEGTRYRDAIRYLVESGVITGFGDGTFRPKAALTRAQACAILARATGNGSASGSASFTDTSGHWAEGAITWCASKGIVSGYGNGKFGPEEQLTGYAWSKMLFVALGFDAEEYGLVGSSWESNVMSLLREKGLDQGMNNFYPEQTIKREEACQLVYNAFVQKLISV